MAYTVKDVAKLAGISIRTLHHYDQIGLLKPERKSPAGYRLYTGKDMERLQEVLFFRELGFDLKEIKTVLDNPVYDRRSALESHKELLQEKKRRITRLIKTVDKTIRDMEGDIKVKEKDLFEGFDDSKLEEYKKEAREHWGHTDAHKESERKTASYTKKDWEEVSAESGDIYKNLADLMKAGRKPVDADVQKQVKRWFDFICERFYKCTPEIFRGLADMYVEDKRFTKNIDKFGTGLAEFKSKAMKIYVDNL